MTSSIGDLIQHNPALTVGVAALSGGLLSRIGRFHNTFVDAIKQNLTCSIRATSEDGIYNTLLLWSGTIASVSRYRKVEVSNQLDSSSLDPVDSRYKKAPSLGTYWAWWNMHLIQIHRSQISPSSGISQKRIDVIVITVMGRNVTVLEEIIQDAFRISDKTGNVFGIFEFSRGTFCWESLINPHVRTFDTLTYDKGLAEDLISDFTWFEESRQWYSVHGIAYRRGYLFSGPHGTGKTSLIVAMAHHFQRKIFVVSLSSMDSERELMSLVSYIPTRGFVLLEDIDAVNASSEQSREESQDYNRKGPISLACMLNILDGATTSEGRVFIMTTNYPERLDPALIRAGRVDRHFKLNNLDSQCQISMAEKFYGSDTFTPLDTPVSPADLQAAFMQYPDDPAAARMILLNSQIDKPSGG